MVPRHMWRRWWLRGNLTSEEDRALFSGPDAGRATDGRVLVLEVGRVRAHLLARR